MVNYAYAFSQSETEKYFKWIIININKWSRMFNCLICLAKQERFFKSRFWRKFHMPNILKWKWKSLKMRIWKLHFIALKNERKNTSSIIVPLKEIEASYIADQNLHWRNFILLFSWEWWGPRIQVWPKNE